MLYILKDKVYKNVVEIINNKKKLPTFSLFYQYLIDFINIKQKKNPLKFPNNFLLNY